MWSKYLRTKKKNEVVAVFHELHPDPIYCSREQWEEIKEGTSGDQKLVNELKEKKVIVESPEDDCQEFEKTVLNLERKLNQPVILYLMTAQGCNFRCGYCPVPATAQKYGEMLLSAKDAIAGIDLWQEHLKDVYNPDLEYFVIFYGGEPLLNKETIKASLAYLKRKKEAGLLPAKTNLMIATNGVLFDEEIISLCKEFKIMITIGLDGPQQINDALRVDINGDGTFNQTIGSISKLIQNGIKTSISVSITPFNVDRLLECSVFFKNLGIEKIGFNFLKGRAFLDLVGPKGANDYYRKASSGIIECSRKQGQPNFEYQMEKKKKAFESKDFYPVDCTCYGNQLVIQPDGQISNCPFYRPGLGHVGSVGVNFRIWEQPIVKEWRKRLPLYHPGEAKALSGGGCAWSSKEIKGDMLAVDDSSKIFAEEVLNELIWARCAQIREEKT